MVRQSAEDKILGLISSLKGIKKKKPGLQIFVTGCFVDPQINVLKTRFPHIDLFFKPGDYLTFLEHFPDTCGFYTDMANNIALPRMSVYTAYIPIIQGCNNFCSYCIVPYRRGREKSRSIEEIVLEVNKYIEQGVREITLLGQNVNSFGHDLADRKDLSDLLYVLNEINEVKRIRFLTNHPKDMSEKLIRTIADIKKYVNIFHYRSSRGITIY
jgi:tRNA-2-methylthio-N6-dimethylallyladenosine synthase